MLPFNHLSFSEKNDFPQAKTIYIVIENENLIYIGATKNLYKRFRHHNDRYFFNGCEIYWIGEYDLRLEQYLIWRFRPERNYKPWNGSMFHSKYCRRGITQCLKKHFQSKCLDQRLKVL